MFYCSYTRELMNQTTQQISPNPALDFAQSILDVTNNGIELIEILRDIAQDTGEVATTNDRIAATNVLNDRAFGKSPRQLSPNPGQASETGDDDVRALREAPTPSETPAAKPESPRLVTQIDESLNRSLGPAPSAARHAHQTPEPFDPNSIHFTIQQHILAITNNGQMMRDILLEIARTCPEPEPALSQSKGRRVTPYHRRRAVVLLLERSLGTDPNAFLPDCRRKWSTRGGSPTQAESSRDPAQIEDTRSDEERWAKIQADLKKLEDQGILTPDPNAPPLDISSYRMPKDFDSTPYEKEEAESFKAQIALQLERQKQWPEIEERRRKKLEKVYPSHSEDESAKAQPPDT